MIGIIGQGFVGNALREYFESNNYPYDIRTFDIKEGLGNTDTLDEVVQSCQYIFVCLPTPMGSDGRCYTGIVDSVLEEINSFEIERVCILKSTIPPGTTQRFNEKYENIECMFSPEFLREHHAVEDMMTQNRIVLGTDNKELGMKTFVDTFGYVVGEHVNLLLTDSNVAETVKYVTNVFLATKVAFSNEIYQLCEKLDIDHKSVTSTVSLDPRIGDSHWDVPGPDGHMGFGGHCFPKDINEFIGLFIDNNIDPSIISSVWNKNLELREDKNWLEMEGRAIIKEK